MPNRIHVGAQAGTWWTGDGPPAPGAGTDGDYYFDDTHRLIYRKAAGAWLLRGLGSASSTVGVPTFIPDGDTFTVPENYQALFAMTIDVEGILEVDGFLIGVN